MNEVPQYSIKMKWDSKALDYVANARELDVEAHGKTRGEALENLEEAVCNKMKLLRAIPISIEDEERMDIGGLEDHDKDSLTPERLESELKSHPIYDLYCRWLAKNPSTYNACISVADELSSRLDSFSMNMVVENIRHSSKELHIGQGRINSRYTPLLARQLTLEKPELRNKLRFKKLNDYYKVGDNYYEYKDKGEDYE